MGRVAVGFRCHSGWAVLVVVTGSVADPVVVDRRRVELVPAALPRQPYHAVAEGAWSSDVIDAVVEAAHESALAALRSVPDLAAVGLVATARQLPPGVDQILASHASIHAAEGTLFEDAVLAAAGDLAAPVHVIEPRAVQVPAAVDVLRRSVGPPWTKDHKWATTVALAALVAG